MKSFIVACLFLFSANVVAQSADEKFLTQFTGQFQQLMWDHDSYEDLKSQPDVSNQLLQVYACEAIVDHYHMATLLKQHEQHIKLIQPQTINLLNNMFNIYLNAVDIDTCLNFKGDVHG